MARVIELFVANHCPSCPDARARVYAFANATPGIMIVEHNVDESLDAAARYGLFTTPAIVIDGRAVFYGVPTLSQLAARCGATEQVGASSPPPHTPAAGASTEAP